jgi:hypothetical protein
VILSLEIISFGLPARRISPSLTQQSDIANGPFGVTLSACSVTRSKVQGEGDGPVESALLDSSSSISTSSNNLFPWGERSIVALLLNDPCGKKVLRLQALRSFPSSENRTAFPGSAHRKSGHRPPSRSTTRYLRPRLISWRRRSHPLCSYHGDLPIVIRPDIEKNMCPIRGPNRMLAVITGTGRAMTRRFRAGDDHPGFRRWNARSDRW